jgi:puromycin-sensitive aminopeptidase
MSFTCCLAYFQVEVHLARSIEEIFDAISYKKGSAVIRMLQGFLGDDMFQVG